MKALLLLPVFGASALLTGCETTVAEHPHHRRVAYVERSYDRHYDRRYDTEPTRYASQPTRYEGYSERYDNLEDERRIRRSNVVVVDPRPAYRPQIEVRYYSDSRGRYYVRDGRRIYVNAGVNY
jgi:hypothetical protein